MTINLRVPKTESELKPRITVVGVGGAGGNAVNNMIRSNLLGVEFVAANTDAQALGQSLAERKVQLGVNINHGLGAGAKPEVGKSAAEESMDEIMDHLQGSNMVFITAGMGGGTGTGAAPVVARAARELGILTVGVVTKPFTFEGAHRSKLAEHGIEELQQYVDTLIVIPNQNLFRIANERTTFADAFKMADDVLYSGVRGVTDLITMPGLINLDFADIQTVMAEMGKAMMGTGEAEGDLRALDASEAAINNPLLDDVSMKGARAVLINITGGMDMTLFEVDEAANRIRSEVDPEANIIFGAFFDEKLAGRMRISIVAAGMESQSMKSTTDSRQQQSVSPFGLGLRPNKILPHADIIATARKPLTNPANTPVSANTSQPQSANNAGGYTSARSASMESPAPMPSPSVNFAPKQAELRTESVESSLLKSNAASESDTSVNSENFMPPKPATLDISTETITVTDRIVTTVETSASETEEARSVPVNLKQERPMEKAMQKPAAPNANPTSYVSTSTGAYTPPSSRPSTTANTTTTLASSSSESATSQSGKLAERSQRRGPGLFERMMGGVLGGKPETQSANTSRVEPTLLRPEAPSAAANKKPATPDMLDTASAENDDLLDIPAFLRRGQ